MLTPLAHDPARARRDAGACYTLRVTAKHEPGLTSGVQLAFLSFAVLHTFASGFGQTFFVGQFVEVVRTDFGLSATEYAGLYSGATILSALVLPWVGSIIDRVDVRVFSLCAALALALACLSMAMSSTVVALFASLFLLRHTGQALMGHTASTAVARHFERRRGTALSITGLGYPASEMIMPALAVAGIAAWGWRGTYAACGVFALCVVGPSAWLLVRRVHAQPTAPPPQAADAARQESDGADDWTVRRLLGSPLAWAMVPLFNVPAFVLTALFFHQASLAEARGWDMTHLAASFAAFGACRMVASLVAGPVVDRLGARLVLVSYLVPLGLGIAVAWRGEGGWAAPVYLGLAGVSQGIAGPSRTAFLVEAFGIAHLGGIRSLLGASAVLGTGVSPILLGWALDRGLGYAAVLPATLALVIAATVLGWGASGRLLAARAS